MRTFGPPHDYDDTRYTRVALAKDHAFAELTDLFKNGWASLTERQRYRARMLARVIAFPEDTCYMLPMARRIGLIDD